MTAGAVTIYGLCDPDKWQEAGSGMQQASHEAMVWLNTHKPPR